MKAGEVHRVLPGVAHFGRNDGKTMARTLVFRVKDKAQPVSVDVKHD